ncbi:MAG: hypothetical protein Q4D19_03425 [Lautropia sp.]|nr:hypothetical protein [Lautropia sp.]
MMMRAMNDRALVLAGPAGQRGGVMLLALIMMAVLVIGATVAAKLSMNSDRVAHNMRARQLALESAESALRWCERQVFNSPQGVLMLSSANYTSRDDEWLDQAYWNSHGLKVPLAEVNLRRTMSATHQPVCLVRHFTLEEWRELYPPVSGSVTVESKGYDPKHFMFYRITARGYSPDYQPSSDPALPRNIRGAVAQVQTMIRSIQ